MNSNILQTINDRPRATVERLTRTFGKKLSQPYSDVERTIPIGIEIECSWRSYFPDLWVEGFPNVSEVLLNAITTECSRREDTLIPKLMKAQACGIPSGADKYWEFAFEPVTAVGILCNQVELLKLNDLIPEGKHALHITIGGLKPSVPMYFIAMILEAYACDTDRLRSGFGTFGPYNTPRGWAKKGRAGLFMKEGSHDLLHGYDVGTEIRTLYTPKSTADLYFLLNTAQDLAEISADSTHPDWPLWYQLMFDLRDLLKAHDLPDVNWGRPSLDEALWEKIATVFPSLQAAVRETFEASVLYCPKPR